MINWFDFVGAFFACGLSLALLIRWSSGLGLVDHPVGRKDHSQPIPVVGGLGILVGLIFGSWLLGPLSAATLSLLIAGTLLIGVGVVDDMRDVHWLPRILTQVLAALALMTVGDVILLSLGKVGPVELALGIFSVPFTVFAVVGLINAVNMVDGLDGLAGTLGLSSLIMMAALASFSGNVELAADLVVCIGAVCAFLAFNLRFPGRLRAHTFLGNGGSALLGLILAWAAIRLSHEGHFAVKPALAPWLVAVPILDCLGLIARRVRQGRSPFAGDRAHLHHLLVDRRMSVNQVIIVCLGLHLTLAGIGVALAYAGTPDWALILGFIAVLAGFLQLTSRMDSTLTNSDLREATHISLS